ncbi:putative disease resistance RPP13-like protein 1 [Pistacia vera]|uniref:putative disease resistance RPP13-like protein 1 n=1 Tax=Pistacia vera TaxID=55513 RepID=UPI00126313DE|nr:putative disease resistance RPP13-like protein 1 [Pistacia vera]XP_031257421.1 putative disease resistance RPP13-like protein 1 [Pistacia vera]XP_031257422.1 putative disease resistance RPP13-like protein 1 [Pistacia vera]
MAFVVEPVVSGLFNGLFEKLGSSEVQDFARQLVGGVNSELDKLKRMLEMVQDLLSDAEDKKLNNNRAVERWLDDLQDWAYDAEDILDKFAHEALQRKLKEKHRASSSRGLNNLPSCFTSPLFNVHTGSKIKDITSSFEQLCKLRTDLGLQVNSAGTSRTTLLPRPEQSSSVQPENFVYGRDEDEAKLVEMAVKSDQLTSANYRVIVIVGMGGIGKTTMARKIYNKLQREDFKFEKIAWVCVSDNFNVLTISKTLLESLNGSSFSIPSDLNGVQVELQNAVKSKKFLVVLDEAWEVDYNKWEQLKSPFIAGAPGSTMIITTRREDVAKPVKCSHIYHLKLLSKEACWSLFKEHALATGTAADADLITDSICKRVLERCSGLPLAAKTLGSLLHSKPIDTWERILDSEIWNSSKEKDVLPVLKLSYLYLPSHLKRCFAYCAVFPEDHEFEEKQLVFLWMAEGIVQSCDTQLDVAGQYFNDLCLRSFFQKSSNNGSKYVQHDLVHNLAELVSKKFSLRSEEATIKLPENVKKIRHFSYIPDHFNGEKKFEGLEKLKSLRTFLPVFTRPHYMYGTNYSDHYITAGVLFDLLPMIKKLRVLSLKRYYITHLPASIGNWIHLRYLNFSYTRIKSLPESTSQLFNLQTLLLKHCSYLVKLPCNMRYLTNLYYLDISGQNSLKEMPSRMKELKNLRMLTNFIVGKEPSLNLEDLKSLSFLQGKLHISKLENVNSVTQMGGPILSNKKDLKMLLLEWGSKFDGSKVERVVEDVLEMLKPHSNLEKLTIRSYGGLVFPSWLSTLSSFSKLTVLRLENCENCLNLPSQSLLSSLKELVIKGMPKLERIDMRIPYNSLEILGFENLENCQYWDTKRENENVESFPKLGKLSIIECPELNVELVDHLPSLEKLVIKKSAKWVVSFSSFPKLTKLEIDECKQVVCTSSSTEFMSPQSESLPNIVESENWLSQNFTCVEKPLKWSHSLISLDSLSLRSSSISFLNTIFPLNLSDLVLENCEALKSLPKRLKQINIESLTISSCDSLLFIARNTLPSSLKRLEISFCKKLQHLEGISSTLLEYLKIYTCESLTCLSSRELLPKTLKSLQITTCPNLTTLSRRWCLHETLDDLYIFDCPKLKSIEEAIHNSPRLKSIYLWGLQNLESNRLFGLQNLTGLQQLIIHNCFVSLPIEGIPTSLTYLCIGRDVEMSKTLIRWGLHNLPSLKHLVIHGFEDPGLILSENQRMPVLSNLWTSIISHRSDLFQTWAHSPFLNY